MEVLKFNFNSIHAVLHYDQSDNYDSSDDTLHQHLDGTSNTDNHKTNYKSYFVSHRNLVGVAFKSNFSWERNVKNIQTLRTDLVSTVLSIHTQFLHCDERIFYSTHVWATLYNMIQLKMLQISSIFSEFTYGSTSQRSNNFIHPPGSFLKNEQNRTHSGIL